ncbi:MAG: phosphomannomutase/phosphoglucomutase [Armatimonadota bacterium]|nr:phosphomannomutase/phosphoglucomutase [Armatimonadota bacterium]
MSVETRREIPKDIFKAYDIRGLYPSELDEESAYRIARAFATSLKPSVVVLGHDMRESADQICQATIRGLNDQGSDVITVGLTSTSMYYYAVNTLNGQAGVMVTASHNPAQYTGYKMTGPEAIPSIAFVSNEELWRLASEGRFTEPERRGEVIGREDVLQDYVTAVLDNAGISSFGDLKIVVDAGNGMAGMILPHLFRRVGSRPIPLFWELDGTFPNHEANPLKEETLRQLKETVVNENADLGVAYDGDADRVRFVDETGQSISGDLITALIAREMLKKAPGARIMYDLRSSWVVPEEIEKAGGVAVKCRVGHGLIKKQMREEGGYFAGELSSHYYFSDFYYTDNGDLAMLNIIKQMLSTGQTMSELIRPLQRYYHSGEINSDVADQNAKLAELEKVYSGGRMLHLDGLTVEFDDWWFNVRPSNTEPLLRLNLEAKTKEKMEEKREELLELIRS